MNGRLELKSLNGQKVILYERHISLAGGAKKRVNMYLPRGTGNPYAVSFMSGDKKLAAARLRLTMLPDLEVAAGILAADPAPLKNLENMKFPMQGQHLTALNLNAEEIPEQSLLLDNLDVLIINDFSTHLLSARQIAAIEKWTQNGGLLVLTGGLAWQKTLSPLPPSLLPVKVTGSMKANSLPGIETLAGEKTKPAGPLVVSRGMVADGQVILSDDGNPLIVQKPVGSGDIVYLAFDPAQPPLDRWSGMTALWSQLLYKTDPHRIISAAASRQGGYRDYNLSWNLRNFPGIDLPTPKILTVILLTYILVLGPGIYLLLKKIDRRDWGWLAIPVLALLLFSITYIAAFKGKDRDVFTNVLSLLSLQEGGGAYSNTYVGAFAPTKTQYRVGLTGDQLISVNSEGNENHRVTIYSSSYGPMSNSEQPTQIIARVEQGDNPEVVFGESSRWSQRYLQCESILERCGNVKSSLICRNGRITGTITNNTGYSLSGAVVFNNYCRQRIGAFKPGQTVTLDLTPRAGHQSAGMIGRAIETIR
ncbi:hypothetical protein [Syntrophomonas palmitatica]|uniref:hypothetical protein n=1 Tax=Syntrophomonas palmitatica TaxID=402877 RepID=UPI0006D0DCC0|nr:hypothetical protein [Syntrophomonas palmitatica]